VRTGEELVDKGVFTEAEYREFLKTREQVVKKLLAAVKTEGPLSGQVTSTAEK